jgi:hypothetical protein
LRQGGQALSARIKDTSADFGSLHAHLPKLPDIDRPFRDKTIEESKREEQIPEPVCQEEKNLYEQLRVLSQVERQRG